MPAAGGDLSGGGGVPSGGQPPTGGAAPGGSGGENTGGSPPMGGAEDPGGAGGSGGTDDNTGGMPMGGGAGEGGDGGDAGGGAGPTGPQVDASDPQLYELRFRPQEADPAAKLTLGTQHARLDTRVESVGTLVVYLHGAGDFSNCGDVALANLVAGWGFHWFGPCFSSNYGVDNCGNDIGGCRLEAFEGVDHHAFIDIPRPDSIEERVTRGLQYLQEQNPEGDWQYFLDGDLPAWSKIIITGHSHGASSSGMIGMHRDVARVVMLAGPYDPGQAWLNGEPVTAREKFFGFTHSGDGQHQGHLAAFEALGLPGSPVRVDSESPPYGGSQRLYSDASVGDAHGSVTSGSVQSFIPVWQYLYGAQ